MHNFVLVDSVVEVQPYIYYTGLVGTTTHLRGQAQKHLGIQVYTRASHMFRLSKQLRGTGHKVYIAGALSQLTHPQALLKHCT